MPYIERKESSLPRFSKNFRDNGVWAVTELSPNEEKEVRQIHRDFLIGLLVECYDDAGRLTKEESERTSVALALFGKRADSIYTVIENRLTQKVRAIRGEVAEEGSYRIP